MLLERKMRNNIVVDTNVFVHLFTDINKDKHISAFLFQIKNSYFLTIDAKKIILGEYFEKLSDILRSEYQDEAELEILRYWMDPENQFILNKQLSANLNQCLQQAIPNNKRDRKFAGTAILVKTDLITNDINDLISNSHSINECANRNRESKINILTSQEANVKYSSTSN